MTPSDYVNEIVLPTVREFRGDRRSRRHAYLACIATFHIKDHLKVAGATGVEEAMQAAEPCAFDVVRAVCNGTKHVEANASHPIPFRAGDDRDRPPADWGVAEWDVSDFDDAEGGRELSQGSGHLDLYKCVRATLMAFKTNFPTLLGPCDPSGL